MVKTAINLYSVRELDEPMLDVVDRVADAGYDGVQISGGFGDASPGAVADRIADRGLEVTPAHVGVEALESDRETVLADFRDTLGVDAVVVPWLPADDFATAAAVDATAERLATLADDLSTDGLSLHYHNHAHEFTALDGENGFDRFVRKSGNAVGIELDVGWALVGGSDPAALIEKYGDRIDLLHMKDMVTAEEHGFREIGEGDVDMAACAAAGRDVGVEWLIYEHDEPTDPAASIRTGASFLQSL